MFRKSYQRAFIWIIITFFLAGCAWAQAGRGKGRLSGSVVDESQNGIPSAKIVCEFIENMELKKEATSNNKGEWAVLGLGTGMWKVTASKDGYIPSFSEVYVRQLERNPRVSLSLKKIEGEGALLKIQAL